MVSNIKNQKWKYLGLLAILPLAMVSFASELVDDAYAQKSEGTPNQKFGSDTENIVCGASLCSTPKGSPDPINEGKAR